MSVFRLRARVLIALGLPAACAPAAPPPPEPPPVPPEPVATAEPVPVEDASAPLVIATDADAPPPPPPPPPPDPQPPVQRGAWQESYKLPPGTERWCTHGSVTCVPAANVIGAPGASMTAMKCPSVIDVKCPCSPAGCNDLPGSFCSAPLQKNVSLRERAKRKDACCYDLPRQCVPPYVGRPLFEDGALVEARSVVREDWCAALGLDGVEADPVLWTRIAGLEHSSVASFARVVLELLALGAPAELVREAMEAGRDELEHARLAYAVARAAGAGEVGPGPLPVPRVESPTLVGFALATLREGCVVETSGAIAARELAEREAHPGLRAVLERIASDEERHALLAWKMLAWALEAGGEAVAGALRAECLDEVEGGREDVVAGLVRPCLDALLAKGWRAPRDSNPRPSDPKSEALSS